MLCLVNQIHKAINCIVPDIYTHACKNCTIYIQVMVTEDYEKSSFLAQRERETHQEQIQGQAFASVSVSKADQEHINKITIITLQLLYFINLNIFFSFKFWEHLRVHLTPPAIGAQTEFQKYNFSYNYLCIVQTVVKNKENYIYQLSWYSQHVWLNFHNLH